MFIGTALQRKHVHLANLSKNAHAHLAFRNVAVHGRIMHMHSLHNSDFRGTGGALLGQHKLTLVVGPALLAQLVSPATYKCNFTTSADCIASCV